MDDTTKEVQQWEHWDASDQPRKLSSRRWQHDELGNCDQWNMGKGLWTRTQTNSPVNEIICIHHKTWGSTISTTHEVVPMGGGDFEWTVVQVLSAPCHTVRGSVMNWFKMPSTYMTLLQSTGHTMSRMFPKWSSHYMGNNWKTEGTLRHELIHHKVANIKTWMEETTWETQV